MNTTTDTNWTEECSTHDLQNGNIWFQHSSHERDHLVRKVYKDGTPASEWTICEMCDHLDGRP